MNYILQILQTLFIVTLIICFVWLLGQLLGRKAGYQWRKILWLVLAVRLLFPLPIPIQKMTDLFRGLEIQVELPRRQPVPDKAFMEKVQRLPLNSIVGAEAGFEAFEPMTIPNFQEKSVSTPNELLNECSIVGWLALIWGAGAAGMLSFRIRQYQCLKKKCLAETISSEVEMLRELQNKLCEELKIRKTIPIRLMKPNSEFGDSPMLFGYFNTMLLLPYHDYNERELEAIVLHELIHYRSGDLWYKFLMVLVCDIYWFNPLLRFMKRMAFRDVEFVCDEKATRNMSIEAKRGYSSTILKTMTGTKKANPIFVTQFAGTKKSARKRFENIFNIPDRKLGIALLCLLIALILGTAFISVTVLQSKEQLLPPVSYVLLSDEKIAQQAEAPVMEMATDSNLTEDKTETFSVEICVELKDREWKPNTNIYEYTEDSVQAIISMQNYMYLEQPYRLMLFADGVPLEFKVDEEICRSYFFTLSGRKQLEIEFQPEFDLQLGRLDFLLFFEGDPEAVFHMTPYTLLMELPEKAQLPDRMQTVVEQSSGNLLLEANAYKPGKYRTVLIKNGQPVCITSQGEQLPCLDWERTGDNVLQLPLELSWCGEDENNFFTVTTPIGSDEASLLTNSMESKKIRIMRP